MLGHYSSGFTLDTYTHITDKMQQEAAEKVGSFMETALTAPEPSVLSEPVRPVMGQKMGHLMGQNFQASEKVRKTRQNHVVLAGFWCRRRDSNPHAIAGNGF